MTYYSVEDTKGSHGSCPDPFRKIGSGLDTSQIFNVIHFVFLSTSQLLEASFIRIPTSRS